MLHLEFRSSETFESHWCPQSGFWDPNSQQGFQLPLSWTWNSRVINIRWVYQYYILCVWFFSPHACDLSYTYSNFLCVWVGVLKYPSMHTLGRPVDIISMISKWKIFILTPTNSISSRLKNFCIVFLLFIFWLCSASNKSNNEVVNRTFNMQSKRQSSQKCFHSDEGSILLWQKNAKFACGFKHCKNWREIKGILLICSFLLKCNVTYL